MTRASEIFSGMGGLSFGLKKAGFLMKVAMDFDADAVATYNRNISPVAIKGDVECEKDLYRFINAATGSEPLASSDLITGGAPCKSYSTSGNRDPLEHRAYYYRIFLDIVRQVQPRAFVFENVPGILSMKVIAPKYIDFKNWDVLDTGLKDTFTKIRRFKDLDRYRRQREMTLEESIDFEALSKSIDSLKKSVTPFLTGVIDDFVDIAQEMGYKVKQQVLNAVYYGSGQARKRLFIVGVKQGDFEFPAPSAFCGECNKRVVVQNGACQIHGERSIKVKSAMDTIGDLIGKPSGFLPNHDITKHKPEFVERISKVAPGKTLYPNFSDAWWRLIPDKPARTIKENHNASGLHFSENRVLTPREMLRFFSLPDDFVVSGVKSSVIRQIGDAVDASVSEAVGHALFDFLSRCVYCHEVSSFDQIMHDDPFAKGEKTKICESCFSSRMSKDYEICESCGRLIQNIDNFTLVNDDLVCLKCKKDS